MPERRRVALPLAAGALLAAPAAGAWSYDASISVNAPCPAAPTALRVEREAAELDCSASDRDALRCAVTARYTLHNPTAEPQRATVSAGDNRASLQVAGGASAQTVEVVVAAGARVELALRDTRTEEIEHRWGWRDPFGEGALGLMHPLLVQAREQTVRMSLNYQRAGRCVGERGWASAAAATLRTRAPRRWAPTTGMEQHGLCRAGDGFTCTQVEETEATSIHMSYERPLAGDVRGGGVTVGLGGTTGQGFRARLGYEIGIGRRFVGSASLEGDTSGNVVLTPALGYAIPLWWVHSWRRSWLPGALIPWVGAPLGVAPDLRGGVRGQLSLIWVFAGLDVAVDHYPRDARTDVTVMVRVGI